VNSAASPEQRLLDLGHVLPAPVGTRFSYLPVQVHGATAYVAGIIPKLPGDVMLRTGIPGVDLTLADARECARLCSLQALAWIRDAAGGLGRVERILRLNGYVQVGATRFGQMSEIIDAASELLIAAFGEDGRHPRSVLGVAELPRFSPVMIDLTVALRPA
jgi:enamine deaminase RidA (YjgF/YER057c/UK114 family)